MHDAAVHDKEQPGRHRSIGHANGSTPLPAAAPEPGACRVLPSGRWRYGPFDSSSTGYQGKLARQPVTGMLGGAGARIPGKDEVVPPARSRCQLGGLAWPAAGCLWLAHSTGFTVA